ncbi:hypothetical protein B4135_2163 [Caldibacillus debilis]|uniref:Uncharacterized protein n=1 Tax=Caldibacillus debilis TaxID=301148 RepID=A0A150M565_9BACI|nr:hypothetical protein B4135_2163 [Caldibacillus debilis]
MIKRLQSIIIKIKPIRKFFQTLIYQHFLGLYLTFEGLKLFDELHAQPNRDRLYLTFEGLKPVPRLAEIASSDVVCILPLRD